MEKWKVDVIALQEENGNALEERRSGVWVREKETQNRGVKGEKTVAPGESHLGQGPGKAIRWEKWWA